MIYLLHYQLTVGDNDFGDIDEKMEDTLTDLRSCRLKYEYFHCHFVLHIMYSLLYSEIITETYWIRMW